MAVVNLNHYLTVQCCELREHIWYLSEQLGYPVNPSVASIDFVAQGHASRFARNYRQHEPEIEDWFRNHSRDDLTIEVVHELLQDI